MKITIHRGIDQIGGCITEIATDKPQILRIKNPDFENNDDFLIEPLTYKITFE